jgi:hypothetical protein
VSIWLLGEMLVEGAGGTIWRASEGQARDGDGCPFCRQAMTTVGVPAKPDAAAASVEVCRQCEAVWVEPGAIPLLPVLPELTAGVTSPGPTHCANCGAPFADADRDRCPYCKAPIPHRELDVAAPLLAELAAKADHDARAGSGLVDAYIDSVTAEDRHSWL